ncbi:MAG: hypothetical protein ABIL58_04015 [Pseudomonadota bacterium]
MSVMRACGLLALVGLLNVTAAIRPAIAGAYDTVWAVVNKGAFVIPSEDAGYTDPEGRAAGKRIGYIPAGDLVRVGVCSHVNGPDEESTGNYCNVHSENGVQGKTIETQLSPLRPGSTYAVARSEIALYDRERTTQPRGRFSRNAGLIVEIVGDWQQAPPEAAVDVIATYNVGKADAVTEVAILKSDLIESTHIIEIPANAETSPMKYVAQRSPTGVLGLIGEPVGMWIFRPATAESAAVLADRVYQDLGWQDETGTDAKALIAKAFDLTTTTLDKILCTAAMDLKVSSGFEVLGNELKLSGALPIYRTGKLFDFDVDVIERDGRVQYWVLTSKTVTCDMGAGIYDSRPRAVDSVTVSVFRKGHATDVPVRLTVDGAKRLGLGIPDAVDRYNIPRLFIIEEYLNYFAARRYIADRIANSTIYDEMSRQERIILYHVLIAKLAYFPREVAPEDVAAHSAPENEPGSAKAVKYLSLLK